MLIAELVKQQRLAIENLSLSPVDAEFVPNFSVLCQRLRMLRRNAVSPSSKNLTGLKEYHAKGLL